ncbi:CPBP family intramembrane glutamic endopeptidase [Peribacillus psychrosaccharolyticus]|uniref:CPBP family intramembrane glutamic endopeptidase n=1 Tax=Peribacillus psychrosaccharolyticus TaxID=1407 RepID=UPI002ED3E689
MIEELIFRGLVFQAIEKMGGSWIALALTSLFFGIAHLGNPGATIVGAFSIAIEAGVLLGVAFLWGVIFGLSVASISFGIQRKDSWASPSQDIHPQVFLLSKLRGRPFLLGANLVLNLP